MHPLWRCWCIFQIGWVSLCSPPVIYCLGFAGSFIYCQWLMETLFTGLWWLSASLVCITRCFSSRVASMNPKSSYNSHLPKAKLVPRITGFHRIKAKSCSGDVCGWREATRTGDSESLPCRPLQKYGSLGITQVPSYSALWALKTLCPV